MLSEKVSSRAHFRRYLHQQQELRLSSIEKKKMRTKVERRKKEKGEKGGWGKKNKKKVTTF